MRRCIHGSSYWCNKTYYEVLGLRPNASDNDIKKAFYQLAKKYHPDTNQGDASAAEKFQEVQRAYDTLRDPQKRSAYDQMGHSAYENVEAGGGTPGSNPFSGGAHVDPEDLFREFFGGGGGGGPQGFRGTIFEHIFSGSTGFGNRPRKGRSIQAGISVTFEESIHGTTRSVDLSSLGIPGAEDNVEVKIPAGVDNGFQIQVDGKGLQGPSGVPPGDLLLQVMVLPSPVFKREGFDLYTEVKLDMVDAALGRKIDVRTADGMAEIKIKPGTQSGDKLRMRGYGVPMDLMGRRGQKGDQFVVVKVATPRNLSARQRQLLEDFREGGNKAGDSDGKGDTTNETKQKDEKKKGWFNFGGS